MVEVILSLNRKRIQQKIWQKEARVEKASIEVYVPQGENTDYLKKSIELYNKKYSTELELNPVDVAPAIPMVQKVTPKASR